MKRRDMKQAVGMLAAALAVWTATSCGGSEALRTVAPVKVETVTVGEASTSGAPIITWAWWKKTSQLH